MKYVKLGNSGVDVSRICLGMLSFGQPGPEYGVFPWAKDFEEAKPIFKKAIELGINFFDTANVYQMGTSEEVTGKLIKEFGLNRDEIVVATKVGREMRHGRPNGKGLSRKEILSEIDKSLKRLQLDYVDLYQIHRLDPGTPWEEIMEALNDVVKSGKARYIGASTMFAWQFQKLQTIAKEHGWTQFITMQAQYNLMYREEEREMVPYCQSTGVGFIPWSPLAGGRLTHPWGTVTARNQKDGVLQSVWESTERLDISIVENLQKYSEEWGYTMAETALAWMLSKPYITAPIVGTTSVKHVEGAVRALDIKLTPEQIAILEAPYQPHPIAEVGGYLQF